MDGLREGPVIAHWSKPIFASQGRIERETKDLRQKSRLPKGVAAACKCPRIEPMNLVCTEKGAKVGKLHEISPGQRLDGERDVSR